MRDCMHKTQQENKVNHHVTEDPLSVLCKVCLSQGLLGFDGSEKTAILQASGLLPLVDF